VGRVEDLERVVAEVREDHPHRQGGEDGDLEDAEDDAGPRREPYVPICEEEDDCRSEEDPDPPLAGVVPAPFVLDDVHRRPGEDQEQQRCNERLEKEEGPADHEAGVRPERTRDVGIEAACRGDLLRQLADRARDEDARDEREEDRQGQDGPRELHRYEDREGDCRTWSHMRDRLEQSLREPDRVLPQVIEGSRPTRLSCHGRLLLFAEPRPIVPDPVGVMQARVSPRAGRCTSSGRRASSRRPEHWAAPRARAGRDRGRGRPGPRGNRA
jgi:hypothetical protein